MCKLGKEEEEEEENWLLNRNFFDECTMDKPDT